jgi:hypothetical protein
LAPARLRSRLPLRLARPRPARSPQRRRRGCGSNSRSVRSFLPSPAGGSGRRRQSGSRGCSGRRRPPPHEPPSSRAWRGRRLARSPAQRLLSRRNAGGRPWPSSPCCSGTPSSWPSHSQSGALRPSPACDVYGGVRWRHANSGGRSRAEHGGRSMGWAVLGPPEPVSYGAASVKQGRSTPSSPPCPIGAIRRSRRSRGEASRHLYLRRQVCVTLRR